VPHMTKRGHYNYKCLLHGCPRSKPYSLKVHINNHWSRDHPDSYLRVSAHDRPGPKKSENSRVAEKEELVDLCMTQSGYFPKRWMKFKRDKLKSKRAEVHGGCPEFVSPYHNVCIILHI
jgi:hypothetical protein